MLKEEVDAWEADRNKKHAEADWRFTTENARVKLKRLYPHYEQLGRLASRWFKQMPSSSDPLSYLSQTAGRFRERQRETLPRRSLAVQ